MTTITAKTTQVYELFIKATPEAIWEAITTPDFTAKYFHGARISNSATKHHSEGPDGSTCADGPVFQFDPPRLLVHEWRSLYDLVTDHGTDRRLIGNGGILVENVGARDARSGGIENESHYPRRADPILHRHNGPAIPGDAVTPERRRIRRVSEPRHRSRPEIDPKQSVRVVRQV